MAGAGSGQGGGEGGSLMAEPSLQGAAEVFDPLRPRLMRVAYRMLGSVADAEDVVQEAFIRWMGVDRDEIREPEALLRRVVTRLCLDQLKSAKLRRETYIGPWLPDPIVEEEVEEDVTLPLMLAMERLSPLERAAFMLHDVFGLGFDEVAATINRDAAACRQLAARARNHVRDERPRFKLEKQRGIELANAFYAASRNGDMSALGGNAGGRCQRPCRRRRQAFRIARSDLGLRRGDDAARPFGRAIPDPPVETRPHRLHQRLAGLRDFGG